MAGFSVNKKEISQGTATNLNATVSQSTAANIKAQVFLGGRKAVTAPTVISLSGTSARNATVLDPGRYTLKATSDCNYLQGDSTVVATASHYPLNSGDESIPYVVTGASDGYFAGINGGAAGSLFIIPEQGQ